MRRVQGNWMRFISLVCAVSLHAAPSSGLKFAFGPREIPGWISLAANDAYTAERGYGFDLESQVSLVNQGASAPPKSGSAKGKKDIPFFFSPSLLPRAP